MPLMKLSKHDERNKEIEREKQLLISRAEFKKVNFVVTFFKLNLVSISMKFN
jgi:tmRNA-binding protein